MKKLRELIRLKCGFKLTNRQVGAALNMSASTVSCYSRAFTAANIDWSQLSSLSDSELLEALTPHCRHLTHSKVLRCPPDWSKIHQELQHKPVTLALLHEEYLSESTAPHLSYSRFCHGYRQWRKGKQCSMPQTHKPGDKCFIDYSGQTVPIYSRDKGGKTRNAEIFVAVLGASNLTYAEASWTQKIPDWISSSVNALSFFGGSPALLVPDNLKSAVSDSNKYDPVINPAYADFAQHYHVAILPSRPYSPQDKGKVENGVLQVQRWILARLRKQKFYSLKSLNNAIASLVETLNDRVMKQYGESRSSRFRSIEKNALKPLPAMRYEYAQFKKALVGKTYHVCVDGNYYSVPHTLIGEKVECRVTSDTVEIIHNHRRVASHIRATTKGEYVTVASHRPKRHAYHAQWSEDTMRKWATTMGDSVIHVVHEIIDTGQHPDKTYRYHLGLKNLASRYSAQRLNHACQRALAIGSITYQSLDSILKSGLDRMDYLQEVTDTALPEHANIRGTNYYKRSEK